MNEITYFFGAGASANTLPIIKKIPKRIGKLIEILSSEELKLDSSPFHQFENLSPKSKYQFQLELIEALNWLREKSSDHASIDTFAKKLFLTSQINDLRKLKTCLIIFFAFEELTKRTDYRYDAFFASIIITSYKFPDNIRILSWNYDNQFELSYLDYMMSSNSISLASNSLSVNSKLGWNSYDAGFGIYKLNGSTTFRNKHDVVQQTSISDFKKDEIDLDLVHSITYHFALSIELELIYPNVSFAWENDSPNTKIVDNVSKIISNTSVLVVIGYSFPFFNRDIDRKIINSMSNLKKVYFQDLNPDMIIDRFKAIRTDIPEKDLVSVINTEQFYLPNEL